MGGIERDNPALKGVLPKDYARPALDKTRLGQLIDLVSNIKVGDQASRAKDVLAASTSTSSRSSPAPRARRAASSARRAVVKLLVEMLEPYRGRVYDPCCGSSGMFVQSVEFIRAHANPPFNVSDWGGERLRDDKRWQYGVPPAGNANFAWVQHIVHHLAPAGVAGFVLANGSMSSNQSGEGEIRKKWSPRKLANSRPSN
jgi:type I restriction enzyme M protein